jgi:crotonobetainyl-CoA:carnitine CoA-transferase CaiB-like acyl-CoA transferase
VSSDEEWRSLRRLLVNAAVQVDELPRLPDRKASEADLDQAVSAWTADLSPWQVTTICQNLGIAAYPLMTSARLAWDSHLHQRDFFQWVTHPVAGAGPIPGVVFRIGDQGARVRGPAPLMGQHNEEVLMGLLGLTQERFDHLVSEGALR